MSCQVTSSCLLRTSLDTIKYLSESIYLNEIDPHPQIIMGDDKQPEGPKDESKIPPLNPEDPLSGLTDEQIKESLAIFGRNEVSIDCIVCRRLLR